MELTDVVIFGAGPAGVACALTCHRHGLRVQVFYKPANGSSLIESIHPGVEVLLDHIGLGHAARQACIGRYKGIAHNGYYEALSMVPGEDWFGLHLERKLFDELLIQALADEEVPLTANTSINIDQYPGRYLVDATGYQKLIGKKMKLKASWLSPPLWSYHHLLPTQSEQTEIAYFKTHSNGWEWSVPISAGNLSVTGVTIASRPEKTEVLKMANSRWRIFDQVAGPGYFLTGDAAGQLDPAAGQGILMALQSGIMAGTCINHIIDGSATNREMEHHYQNWYQQLFRLKAQDLAQRYRDLDIGW